MGPSPSGEKLFKLFDDKRSGEVDFREVRAPFSFCPFFYPRRPSFCLFARPPPRLTHRHTRAPAYRAQFLIALSNFCPLSRADKLQFAFSSVCEAGDVVISKDDLKHILKANLLSVPAKDVERRAETVFAMATRMFGQQAAPESSDEELSFDQFLAVAKLFPNVFFSSLVYVAPTE